MQVDRLAEDHTHARLLATELATVAGVSVDMSTVQSNIVYINLDAGEEMMMCMHDNRARDGHATCGCDWLCARSCVSHACM